MAAMKTGNQRLVSRVVLAFTGLVLVELISNLAFRSVEASYVGYTNAYLTGSYLSANFFGETSFGGIALDSMLWEINVNKAAEYAQVLPGPVSIALFQDNDLGSVFAVNASSNITTELLFPGVYKYSGPLEIYQMTGLNLKAILNRSSYSWYYDFSGGVLMPAGVVYTTGYEKLYCACIVADPIADTRSPVNDSALYLVAVTQTTSRDNRFKAFFNYTSNGVPLLATSRRNVRNMIADYIALISPIPVDSEYTPPLADVAQITSGGYCFACNNVIGRTDINLPASPGDAASSASGRETNLGDLVTDALRWEVNVKNVSTYQASGIANVDVAMMSSSDLAGRNLTAGTNFTAKMVRRFAFADNSRSKGLLQVWNVTGAQLVTALRFSSTNNSLPFLQVAGISYNVNCGYAFTVNGSTPTGIVQPNKS